MDAFDHFLIDMMHKHIPITNIKLAGFPIGEWLFYYLLAGCAASIYLMLKGGKNK